MDKTSGLGRGLGSLIPSKKDKLISSLSSQSNELGGEQVLQLSVEQITPNPHQPRTNFDEESLKDLMDSISEHGIIQPVVVSKVEDGWELIVGERRLRAVKALGLKTIPAIERSMSEQKKMEVALIENLQRKNLNALETANAYQKLMDEFNLSQDELAVRVGKSRPAIANTLRILGATDEVKDAIRSGKISEGHARNLVSLPEDDQIELLDRVVSEKLNVRETERATHNVVVDKNIRKVNVNPDIDDKAEKLQQALGTKVEIKKFGQTGQIIIKFFSDEELEEVLRKIM